MESNDESEENGNKTDDGAAERTAPGFPMPFGDPARKAVPTALRTGRPMPEKFRQAVCNGRGFIGSESRKGTQPHQSASGVPMEIVTCLKRSGALLSRSAHCRKFTHECAPLPRQKTKRRKASSQRLCKKSPVPMGWEKSPRKTRRNTEAAASFPCPFVPSVDSALTFYTVSQSIYRQSWLRLQKFDVRS